jgi:hypothetical protein
MAAIPASVGKTQIGMAATREDPPEELTQASAARVGPNAIVSANQQQRDRQQTAERRVDIGAAGGAGNDGRRSMGPRGGDVPTSTGKLRPTDQDRAIQQGNDYNVPRLVETLYA